MMLLKETFYISNKEPFTIEQIFIATYIEKYCN